MKKLCLSLLLAGMMFASIAQAQLLPGEKPAEKEQIRNLVEILLPESAFNSQKTKTTYDFQTAITEKFSCVEPGSDLYKEITVKIEEMLSYDTMIERLEPLFGELSAKEVLQILSFYKSDAGLKWIQISTMIPEEASKAGVDIGAQFAPNILPILAKNEDCMHDVLKLVGKDEKTEAKE